MRSTGIDHIWSLSVPVLWRLGGAVPVHLGEAQRVHGDDHHLAGPAERRQAPSRPGRSSGLESPEHLGQPQIFGEAAIEEVKVRAGRILIGLERAGAEQRATWRLGLADRGLGSGLPAGAFLPQVPPRFSSVMGVSSGGSAVDVAMARPSVTFERSPQIASNGPAYS